MAPKLKDSKVIFKEDTHQYFLNGKELQGITKAIQTVLYPRLFDGIPENILTEAASYGTAVHKSIQEYYTHFLYDELPELNSYLRLSQEHSIIPEANEYTVTDGVHYASKIDIVAKTQEANTFDLYDIKTYASLSQEKKILAMFQLGIYAAFFEMQNKKCRVGNLYVLHIRHKEKSSGEIEDIAERIPIPRVPSEIALDLLDCYLTGQPFNNPYDIPQDIRLQEDHIRELLVSKEAIENELKLIKANIQLRMESLQVKSWQTETMKLTLKAPSTRQTFNLPQFKQAYPDLPYEEFTRESSVAGSLLITI